MLLLLVSLNSYALDYQRLQAEMDLLEKNAFVEAAQQDLTATQELPATTSKKPYFDRGKVVESMPTDVVDLEKQYFQEDSVSTGLAAPKRSTEPSRPEKTKVFVRP